MNSEQRFASCYVLHQEIQKLCCTRALAQRPRHLNNKLSSAHLCANGSLGLREGCGQAHCWRIAILWHQKVSAIKIKSTSEVWCSVVLLFTGSTIWIHVHKVHTFCL